MHDTEATLTEADIHDENLRRVLRYWNEKRGTRACPSRSDIDALDLHYVLGSIVLIDVLHDPLRFRYRLHGTRIVERDQCDMTGKFLEEYPKPEFRNFLKRAWIKLVETAKPTHEFYDQMVDDRVRQFEVIRLPLSTDGKTIDMILIAAVPRR